MHGVCIFIACLLMSLSTFNIHTGTNFRRLCYSVNLLISKRDNTNSLHLFGFIHILFCKQELKILSIRKFTAAQ